MADNSEKFAESICQIINQPNIRNELMMEGKKVIRDLLSWDRVVGEFESYLRKELTALREN